MRNIFVISCAVCLALFSTATMNTCAHLISQEPLSNEQKLDQLNEQIKMLKDEKLGYEGRALYNENKAQRIQFIDGEQATAKKLWQIADANRQMAQDIDGKIKELEKQRNDLLRHMKGQ